jgi:hypothetical protein
MQTEIRQAGAIAQLVSLLKEKMPRPKDEDEEMENAIHSATLAALVALAQDCCTPGPYSLWM